MTSLALTSNAAANLDNLLSDLLWFFSSLTPTVLFAVATAAVCVAFFVYYWCCLRPRPHSLEWIAMSEENSKPRSMTLTLKRHPFERHDWIPMLLLTVIYAATAFFRLGDMTAPQTYTVFQKGDSYTFSFAQPVNVDRITYYTAIGTGSYTLEYADEQDNWRAVELDQGYNTLLKWRTAETDAFTASVFRVTTDDVDRYEGLWLSELALWNGNEKLVPDYVSEGGETLFDESDLWAAKSTYMNSSYFDEIYHPRTALEHLENVYPYEVSHPPLGKLIISLGVYLFGMTPFGWRFAGTLFGVLMLPVLYVFLKNLFGKTAVAACGTALFAFDFMHLVQTRISTIDTYGVFFILVSYYYMYRWLSVPAGSKLRKSALPLFLCGLFWGIGCASKWTVVYAGIGLALLWLLGLIFKSREWYAAVSETGGPGFASHVLGTFFLSILFFVVIPVCVYTASYLPYLFADAEKYGTDPSFYRLAELVWNNQKFMLTYHQGVHSSHPYESYWYQWIVDIRPILYYRDASLADINGTKSLFASFNNPVVSWAGLLAFIGVIIQTVRRKCGKGLFIIIAMLSQFVPWLGIGRTLFAYHYFPTVLFLVFAIAYLMDGMLTRRRKGFRLAVYGLTGWAVALYAIFYPALIGLSMPLWYAEYVLRWFPTWPL